jgi:hypothetical protein
MSMIFVLATDDFCLEVYPTKEEAIAACEGVDVEDGNYLFWDGSGFPLIASFSEPNERGRFTVLSGVYDLLPASSGESLLGALSMAKSFEGHGLFSSIEAVRRHLTNE